MHEPSPHPQPFLEALVEEGDLAPPLVALCAGFELRQWRLKHFAGHLMEWLPEFALTWAERERFKDATAVRLMRRAAQRVYDTDVYDRRGEFGELVLHAVLRQVFQSEVAISKLFFKDAANNTVKGFDAVHIVPDGESLQLWLGEVKFYDDLSSAISHVVKELQAHTDVDYLQREFALILDKIDPSWPYGPKLSQLLDPNTSLDEVFDVLCVPVLLTYDSRTVGSHTERTSDYIEAFRAEVLNAHGRFASKALPNVRIHLLLVPLATKADLVAELHKRLEAWQQL